MTLYQITYIATIVWGVLAVYLASTAPSPAPYCRRHRQTGVMTTAERGVIGACGGGCIVLGIVCLMLF